MPMEMRKNAMLEKMEKSESKLTIIVLYLLLIFGTIICFLWWGFLGFLVIAGVRLLFRF